ncbi:MAG: hypothetical protein U9R79_00245 [Armatimonadota bacterium]|nr:hypothetical protein [Armatimonadota bacterium]
MRHRGSCSPEALLVRALTDPWSLGIGAAVGGVALFMSPTIGALLVPLWVLAVFVIYQVRWSALRLPVTIQRRVEAIEAALADPQESLGALPGDTRRVLEDGRRSLADLRRAVHAIAGRAAALSRRLESIPPADIEEALAGRRQALASPRDAQARREIARSIQVLQTRLRRRRALQERLGRYEVTMSALQTDIEDMTERVAMLAMGDEGRSGDLPAHQLARLAAGVAALEQVMGSEAQIETDTESA